MGFALKCDRFGPAGRRRSLANKGVWCKGMSYGGLNEAQSRGLNGNSEGSVPWFRGHCPHQRAARNMDGLERRPGSSSNMKEAKKEGAGGGALVDPSISSFYIITKLYTDSC